MGPAIGDRGGARELVQCVRQPLSERG